MDISTGYSPTGHSSSHHDSRSSHFSGFHGSGIGRGGSPYRSSIGYRSHYRTSGLVDFSGLVIPNRPHYRSRNQHRTQGYDHRLQQPVTHDSRLTPEQRAEKYFHKMAIQKFQTITAAAPIAGVGLAILVASVAPFGLIIPLCPILALAGMGVAIYAQSMVRYHDSLIPREPLQPQGATYGLPIVEARIVEEPTEHQPTEQYAQQSGESV